jgi:hypothetical protein
MFEFIIHYKSNFMASTIKWIALGIVCAILAFILYPAIDSNWAADNHVGILVTIGFFASASITILCGFNVIESTKDHDLEH